MLSIIPGVEQINKIADNRYVLKAENLSKSIVLTTTTVKTVIEDIKTAFASVRSSTTKEVF
jgi:hypothetical protein